MNLQIRPYQPSDLAMLYDICLRTGATGKDASGLVPVKLLGDIYAAPYVHYEPQLCFVLLQEGEPVGYILGCSDSASYGRFYNEKWLPPLLSRYEKPEIDDSSFRAAVLRSFYLGYSLPPGVNNYPAHLHIDILPQGQGQGMGRELMQCFLQQLGSQGILGVHFVVSKLNLSAIAFYQHLGFHKVSETASVILFGMLLSP